jgi:hypothetical protein
VQARGGEQPSLLRDVQADRVDRRDGGNGQIWFLQAAGVAVPLPCAHPAASKAAISATPTAGLRKTRHTATIPPHIPSATEELISHPRQRRRVSNRGTRGRSCCGVGWAWRSHPRPACGGNIADLTLSRERSSMLQTGPVMTRLESPRGSPRRPPSCGGRRSPGGSRSCPSRRRQVSGGSRGASGSPFCSQSGRT